MSDARTPVIVGVAESDLGVTTKSVLELQAQAARAALADAGLTLGDVDGLCTNTAPRMPAVSLAEYLGVRPTWTDATASGGSSFEIYVHHVADAIRAGRCDVALITYGSTQKSGRTRRLGGAGSDDSPAGVFEAPFGPLLPMGMYALAAQRHMHEFGTTPEQLAEVAVSAREWALLNPDAYRHGAGPLTAEDVLGSPMVSSPLHTLDCCLVTDGGGAVVLTTLERARDLPSSGPPVHVLGHAEASSHMSIAAMPDLTATDAAVSAARAFGMAGIAPGDVDLAMLYDSFTITVLLTLEALGFCGRGEAGGFVADGRTRPGGSFPMNTNGGGLSYCHPGQYGIFLLIEAARQLQGRAGDRQVDGVQVAVAHGTGGILSTHATVVLGADR